MNTTDNIIYSSATKTIVRFIGGTKAELLGDAGPGWVTVRYPDGKVADRLASRITKRFEVAR